MFEGLSFDELNSLVTASRSEPYESYFGSMEITEAQKKKRVAYAYLLEEEFLSFLLLLFYMQKYNNVNWEKARIQLQEGYIKAAKKFITVDEYIKDYIKGFSYDMIDSTQRHEQDPYYYSTDRAKFSAENESNTGIAHEEYNLAVKSGKTRKQWIDVRDKRERATHLKVGRTIKPIGEPFVVGDSLLMFPKDYSLGAGPEEIVNCRCSIKYL